MPYGAARMVSPSPPLPLAPPLAPLCLARPPAAHPHGGGRRADSSALASRAGASSGAPAKPVTLWAFDRIRDGRKTPTLLTRPAITVKLRDVHGAARALQGRCGERRALW